MATVEISQVGSTFTTRIDVGMLRGDFEGTLRAGTRVQVWRWNPSTGWHHSGTGTWSSSGPLDGFTADLPGLEDAETDLIEALIDREGMEPSIDEPRSYPVETAREVAALRPDLCAGDAVAAVLTAEPDLTAAEVIAILDARS